MAILKTHNEVLQVALQIKRRNIDGKIGAEIFLYFQLFAFMQILLVSGCPRRTLAGHQGSSTGRMALQWTNPSGQVDNRIMQVLIRRPASISTLEMLKCATGDARTMFASSVFFP